LLSVTGFDGRRMAHFQRALIGEDRSLLIQSIFASHLISELRGENALIYASPNWVSVRHDKGGTTVKLSEGQYPNYKQVTSARAFELGVLVPSEFLKRACTNAINLAEKYATPAIRLTITAGTITAQFVGPDEYEDESPCEGEIEFKTKLNAHYLIDAVASLGAEKVTMLTVKTALCDAVFVESCDVLMMIAPLRDVVKEELK